jgi:AraC family transcriptional regulator
MSNHKKEPGEKFLILAPRENDISLITPRLPTLSSSDMKWNDIHFEYHHQPPFQTSPHCFVQHVVTIQSAPHPVNLERSLDGCSWEGKINTGSSFIVPESIEHTAHTFTETEFIVLSLEPSLVNPIAYESIDPDRVEIIPHIQENFDPLIYGIGLAFKREIESNGLGGRLYIDALTTTLSVHLLHQYSGKKPILKEYINGLSQYKIRRLMDYIDNHIAEDLSLAELASEVGMSQYYFARLFKQSIGLTPHQYVIQRRVARAKKFLLEGKSSISDIALMVGFADQSHLTYHFKRLLGVTPKTVLMENGKNLLKKQESSI